MNCHAKRVYTTITVCYIYIIILYLYIILKIINQSVIKPYKLSFENKTASCKQEQHTIYTVTVIYVCTVNWLCIYTVYCVMWSSRWSPTKRHIPTTRICNVYYLSVLICCRHHALHPASRLAHYHIFTHTRSSSSRPSSDPRSRRRGQPEVLHDILPLPIWCVAI